ncbi:MAG: NAD(+) synthase [bacterium]
MHLVKVAAAVLNQTPLDWIHNRDNIIATLHDARNEGASIVCLPEMCITGYGCEDAFHAPNTHEMAWQVLQELLPHTHGMIVSLGLPVVYNNGLYNAVCLVSDGQIAGFVAKQYLAGDGIHYEPRWFKAWPADKQSTIRMAGVHYPIGDLYFDCGGIRIGFEICEDAWVARRPGSDLAQKGVDIILNPSASHFAFSKLDVRKRFVIEGSRAFGVTYVYSNLLGNEAGRVIYDGGAVIASAGKLLATGPRLSFDDRLVTTAVVDVDQTRVDRIRTVSFVPQVDANRPDCVEVPFSFPTIGPEPAFDESSPWEQSKHLKEEEFSRAIALALFDYMRKSRSRGFIVSLSGGADSSAVACLCGLMVSLGVKELGLDGFKEKLAYMPELETAQKPDELIRKLLTTVYQSTRNSGEVTRNAARAVAEAVGADHLELDVDDFVQNYTGMVSRAISRPLTWDADDVTLQNIQARVRGPGVWMLANIRGALLLSTSNRSEAAVGYATMDGDTCGGLSPIAGIDKAFLRRWLSWIETDGPMGHPEMPALSTVTAQVPTAELRPRSAEQTDEGDLMPYDLLDSIERLAIRDKKSPMEVYTFSRATWPMIGEGQLLVYVERFFRLWCRNQWKRERYAPSFHVDDENLDPKTWCRFPILSGGFEYELAQLREQVLGATTDLDETIAK